MKLPIPFIKKKKNEKEYFLALLLDEEKASSVILEEELGKAKIVGTHDEHLTTHIEDLTQDELIKIIDKTISRAEEILPPDVETHKTVFGVQESWVDKETKKIKKEHLTRLKKVCDTLDLTPIGFMEIHEAIANLLQVEEGAPLSGILVELGKKIVRLTLFRGGNITESTKGTIEHSAMVSVDNLLKNFTAPVLPARIILYTAHDPEATAQHFTRHEWSKSLPFLHVPQISTLPKNFEAKAVAFGATQQMGFEILGILDKKEVEDLQLIDEKSNDVSSEDEPKDEAPVQNQEIQNGDDFGFVKNEDVALRPPQPSKSVVAENTDFDNASHVNFDKELEPQEDLKEDLVKEENTDVFEKTSQNTNIATGVSSFISRFKLPKLSKFPKSINFLNSNKGLRLPLLIILGVVGLIIGIWFLYLYSAKAQIVLSVKPKDVSQESDVTFSASSENDFSKNIVAGKSISTTLDGDLTTPATGKKDTGEKAKGNITIYNSSDKEQSVSSGTVVKSNNGISFTLDKDITVASASGDIFSGTKPGTTTTGITAKDIGTEGNLPSGTKFAIGGNTSLAGKNDSAFSGGTKKAITVVSKEDLVKLKTDLPKSLENKAMEDLSGKKEEGETILSDFIDISLDHAKFDKDVDDEAKIVKLTASVKFEGLSYKNSDIENFDKSILKDHFSQDISFAEGSLKNEITDTKVNKDGNIEAKIKVTGGLLPKIEKDEVINKLKDKSPKQAAEILQTLPQVSGTQIRFVPNLLFFPNFLPRLPKNIEFIVKSDE